MKNLILTFTLSCLFCQFSTGQDIALTGTIWIENDLNGMYNEENGEEGKDGIKVYLVSADSNEIVDSVLTEDSQFNFPSTEDLTLDAGTYFLEVDIEAFDVGGELYNFDSCPGANDANDGVDSDDNGMDNLPVQTTEFSLDGGLVEYVDLCFYADCNSITLGAWENCESIPEEFIHCSITNLDNLCGLMPSTNSFGNQPNPLCFDGGAAHNISWFAFIADGGDYAMTVTPTGCFGSTTGLEGVQMGIYTDCTFQESVYCNPDCSLAPLTIESDLLIPGQTYYFFIDGCSGSVCSYLVEITGNPTPPTVEVDEVCILVDGMSICEDMEFCADVEISFQTIETEFDANYTWEIITLSGGPYIGNPSLVTEENNIELTFDNIGIYSVCLTSLELSCSELNWNGQQCRTVSISNVTDEVFDTINVCEDALMDFDINVVGEEDPNGDGVMGWVDTTTIFDFGKNVGFVMDENQCIYQQEIYLRKVKLPEIKLNFFMDTICLGGGFGYSLINSSDHDSITWAINGIPQTDSFNVEFPTAGEFVYSTIIYNQCGTDTAEATMQVLDTISAPAVMCDTSNAGIIVLSWPVVEGVEGYWLSINEDTSDILTDTFYIIENLASGEIVDIAFNLLDSTKCVESEVMFTCTAKTIVDVQEIETNDFRIIPNPAYDFLTIDGELSLMNSRFYIYSIEGELVRSGNLDMSGKVNVMDLPAGLYLIKLIENGSEINGIGRFIKSQ